MENQQFEDLMKELKIIKKLLTANLYSSDVPSENLSKITGMSAGDIRKLIPKRKIKIKKTTRE